jgi:hypothetical protein
LKDTTTMRLATITKRERSEELAALCDHYLAAGGKIAILAEDLTAVRIATGHYRVAAPQKPMFKTGIKIPEQKPNTFRDEMAELDAEYYHNRQRSGRTPDVDDEQPIEGLIDDGDRTKLMTVASALANGLSLSGSLSGLSINHPADGIPDRSTGLIEHHKAEARAKRFAADRGLNLKDLTVVPAAPLTVVPPRCCWWCIKPLPYRTKSGQRVRSDAKFCPDTDHGQKFARRKSKLEKEELKQATLRGDVSELFPA